MSEPGVKEKHRAVLKAQKLLEQIQCLATRLKRGETLEQNQLIKIERLADARQKLREAEESFEREMAAADGGLRELYGRYVCIHTERE